MIWVPCDSSGLTSSTLPLGHSAPGHTGHHHGSTKPRHMVTLRPLQGASCCLDAFPTGVHMSHTLTCPQPFPSVTSFIQPLLYLNCDLSLPDHLIIPLSCSTFFPKKCIAFYYSF